MTLPLQYRLVSSGDHVTLPFAGFSGVLPFGEPRELANGIVVLLTTWNLCVHGYRGWSWFMKVGYALQQDVC